MTLIVYFISIVALRSYFDLSYISFIFMVKIILLVVISWAPLFLFKLIYDYFDPSEH